MTSVREPGRNPSAEASFVRSPVANPHPMRSGPLGLTEDELTEALGLARLRADAEPLSLGEALLRLWADRAKPVRPGPKSKEREFFLLTLECLKETKGREHQARGLFVERVRINNPMAPASASKQFTRAMKQVRTLNLTFFERE
jgi:hypothetical protein